MVNVSDSDSFIDLESEPFQRMFPPKTNGNSLRRRGNVHLYSSRSLRPTVRYCSRRCHDLNSGHWHSMKTEYRPENGSANNALVEIFEPLSVIVVPDGLTYSPLILCSQPLRMLGLICKSMTVSSSPSSIPVIRANRFYADRSLCAE